MHKRWPIIGTLSLPAAIVFAVCVVGGSHGQATAESPANVLAPAAGQTVRALVVGIDHYANPRVLPTLGGAVADARDLEAALRTHGVTDLTLLIDAEATRARILDAFKRLEAASKPGDLVLVSFAGHGSQEPERFAGNEPDDGKDEVFLLAGFDVSGPATRERLIDDEMFELLRRLTARGAEVLFFTDSCHGGGLSKGADPETGEWVLRGVKRVDSASEQGLGAYFIDALSDLFETLPAALSDNAALELPGLTFVAGVEPQGLVIEIKIDGQPTRRGAASYALARALGGAADAAGDNNGLTTRAELLDYVRGAVRTLTAKRQNPVIEPRTDDALGKAVFRLGPATASAGTSLKIAVAGASDNLPPVLGGLGRQIEVVATGSAADLVFDAPSGNVVDPSTGSVLVFGATASQIVGASRRVAARARIEQLAAGRSLAMTIEPAREAHLAGERFDLGIGGLSGRYLTLFNIAGDGTIQFLLPAESADSLVSKDSLRLPVDVADPFGTDVIVAIATATRRTDLELSLKALDGEVKPDEALALLEASLGPEDRIGSITYSTRPK